MTEEKKVQDVKKEDKSQASDQVAEPQKKEEPKKKKEAYKTQFSYADPLQGRLVNCIMKDGKKSVAQRILRDTLEEIHRRGENDPLKVLEKALENATPTMEVRPRRVGGAIYQIPTEVNPKRQQTLSVRWILQGARSRKGEPMYRRLAFELIEAFNERGYAYGKKEEMHKMAQSNKAFAHLARY